jgi:Ca2+-transporting ATPase
MNALLPFHAMSAQDAMTTLRSSVHGLSTAEAIIRLRDASAWRIAEPKPTSIFRVLLRQCASPFVAVLFGAAAISWWSNDIIDAVLTLVIVCANVILGFVQELQADRAFFALQHYLPKTATVRRDGVVMTIDADALVPGDILLIRAGMHVLADGRLLRATMLSVSEAALSGESNPVEKTINGCASEASVFDRRNMVYAGTSVLSGEGEMIVSALGKQTQFGAITTLTADTISRETPLEGEMKKLSKVLTVVILLIAVGMLSIEVTRGIPFLSALTLAAALAIAAIPEGLPMTLTVLLSAAMRRMLKRGVLVRHLVATEALGCVSVLCVDKTGTLTTGVMTVSESVKTHGKEECFDSALRVIASVHRSAGAGAFAGAATAEAIARYVEDTLSDEHRTQKNEHVRETLPFDPAYRFSAYRVDEHTVYTMGAPDVLVERLGSLNEKTEARAMIDAMASRGLRVIMIVTSKVLGELNPKTMTDCELLGCVGIEDPLRSSVPHAIGEAAAAGIRTIMMTGDHPETARTIAMQAFDHQQLTVMLGEDFAAQSPAERLRSVQHVNVFARMLPQHKLLVVEALHAHGLRVAMTGDGVNDAPALKAADVGIAVGHATEVAKEASDLVLVDGDFTNIVRAIAEGRAVFTNARNVTIFLLALGLGETFCILGSFMFGLPLPLSPLVILWLNMVTDGIPGLFFAFEPADDRAMREPPRNANDGLVSAEVQRFFVYSAVIMFIALSAALVIADLLRLPPDVLRTAAFLGLGLLGLGFIFVTRSLRHSGIVNILRPSPLRYGAIIGCVFLIIPFIIPSARSLFALTIPSLPILVGVIGFVLVILLPLDLAKRRFARE